MGTAKTPLSSKDRDTFSSYKSLASKHFYTLAICNRDVFRHRILKGQNSHVRNIGDTHQADAAMADGKFYLLALSRHGDSFGSVKRSTEEYGVHSAG
jgi:hypothetical protein